MRLAAASLAALWLATIGQASPDLNLNMAAPPGTLQEDEPPPPPSPPPLGRNLRGIPEDHSHRRRWVQELQAYVADTNRMDPKVANSPHHYDDGGAIKPHYNTLSPSPIAHMGPEMDALQNFQGLAGMGPGSVAMGITRDIDLNAEEGPQKQEAAVDGAEGKEDEGEESGGGGGD